MATVNINLPFNGRLYNQSLANTLTPITSCHFSSKCPKSARSFPLTYAVSSTSQPKTNPSSGQVKEVISEKWREIQGHDNWAGMLDPMDPLLRSELIRYGEMAQACYTAFDNDPYSKYCGSCKFPPKAFFQNLEMGDSGYEIASYLYSSNTSQLIPKFFTKSIQADGPWNPMVNWMGYVAVSNDETTARLGRRDIIIAWRGTVTKLEWLADLISFLKPVSAQQLSSPDPGIKVMAGFLHIYTDKDQSCPYSMFSARELLVAEIKRLRKMYGSMGEDMSITITGHSLGSSLALLSAYDIAESGLNILDNKREIPVSVFSFSGPRVGNTKFKKRLEALGVKVLRIFNVHDKVPDVPGVVFNEHTSYLIQPIADWTTLFYSHVGEKLGLDETISPFVKENLDVASFHNLELIMHVLDGYHGKGMKFSLTSGRDKALVNMDDDILKEEYLIPPNWSQIENKGLRKNQNGEWELPEQKGIEDRISREQVELHLQKLGLV